MNTSERKLRYDKTEKGRARKRKYNASDKGKAARRRYEQTEKGRAAQSRYEKSDKGKARRRNDCRVFVCGMYMGMMGFTKQEREELLRHGKAE